MAKSPTERNRSYRDRIRVKLNILSELERERRAALADQFDHLRSVTEGAVPIAAVDLLDKVFYRTPQCRIAPEGVVYDDYGIGIKVTFNIPAGMHEYAAAFAALETAGVGCMIFAAAHGRIPRPAMVDAISAHRSQKLLLSAVGLWGDDPL